MKKQYFYTVMVDGDWISAWHNKGMAYDMSAQFAQDNPDVIVMIVDYKTMMKITNYRLPTAALIGPRKS